ncbi:MAG: Transcriptional regulator, FmdB family [Jatrophihabitans sp.]|nr:Transcriptional regulator, FmdB family [Jatrophihabitans sp.]
MPTYQYVCTNPACAEDFERVQSFTDPAASECPVCGGAVRKKFSAVGVVFKGSGFYRTDSRSENAAKASKESGDSSAKDSGSKDSGSKDSGSKDAGSKDSGSKDAAAKGSSSAKDPSSSSKSSSSSNGSSSSSSAAKSGKAAAPA